MGGWVHGSTAKEGGRVLFRRGRVRLPREETEVPWAVLLKAVAAGTQSLKVAGIDPARSRVGSKRAAGSAQQLVSGAPAAASEEGAPRSCRNSARRPPSFYPPPFAASAEESNLPCLCLPPRTHTFLTPDGRRASAPPHWTARPRRAPTVGKAAAPTLCLKEAPPTPEVGS